MSSEPYFDEYDQYDLEPEKYVHVGHSGKHRSKKEAAEHTNHFDPSGHTRKLLEKMINTEKNRDKKAATQPPPPKNES
jgi:hypothetical protein